MLKHVGRLFCFIGAAAVFFAPAETVAQPFPSKPVRIVVPLTPGGVFDILARAVAGELSTLWGQQVIVENRPGANAIIATEFVVKSAPNGYTMLFTNPTIAINQFLYKKLPYDVERDLVPVFNVIYAPSIIVIHPQLPAKTLREFVALAKSRPGAIAYGSFGIGSSAHVDMELLCARVGIKLNHVPYKGNAEMMPAIVAGHIQGASSSISSAYQLVRERRLRGLVVSSSQRSKLIPDVPTLAEAGYPDLTLGSWAGLVAPTGTPRPVIDKIATDLAAIFSHAEFRDRVTTDVGLYPVLQTPSDFAEFLRRERAKYSKIIATLNIPLN